MRVDWPTLDVLTPEERGDLLATQPENQWFERKSLSVGVEVFAKALIGLANAEGGLVVVGVSNGTLQTSRIPTAASTNFAEPLRLTAHRRPGYISTHSKHK